MSALNETDIALAGEYVLGLLDPSDRASVEARIATDAIFATEVEAWRDRLASMAVGVEAAPPGHIWSAVEKALPATTGQDRNGNRLRLWQGLTALSATAAAIMAIMLWQQPMPPTTPAAAPMVAALDSENGAASIAASYDSSTGELILMPVELDTGTLYPELWIIPADGQARSLGMMAVNRPTRVTVAPEMRPHMSRGSLLVVTPEAEGGARDGKATGPVIASGQITTI